eukprot:2521530-Amphidinium_carterae.1
MAVFDFGEITEVLVFRVLVMFYWTLDLCANFFVGFHLPTGEVELRLDVVAKRYLAGWFIPDICLVMIDWLTYGAAVVPSQDGFQEMQPLKILRLGKLARALRVVRVLLKSSRILKLPTILSRIDNSVGRERTVVLLGIMKNVVMILLLNHFLACAWYWIGSRDKVQRCFLETLISIALQRTIQQLPCVVKTVWLEICSHESTEMHTTQLLMECSRLNLWAHLQTHHKQRKK